MSFSIGGNICFSDLQLPSVAFCVLSVILIKTQMSREMKYSCNIVKKSFKIYFLVAASAPSYSFLSYNNEKWISLFWFWHLHSEPSLEWIQTHKENVMASVRRLYTDDRISGFGLIRIGWDLPLVMKRPFVYRDWPLSHLSECQRTLLRRIIFPRVVTRIQLSFDTEHFVWLFKDITTSHFTYLDVDWDTCSTSHCFLHHIPLNHL